jgi:type II secretory pathway pseudopilin PulG
MNGFKLNRMNSAGFALGEMLLAVAIVAVLVGIGAVVYGNLRAGITADDQASKTISLAAEIQKNYRNAGTYMTLSAAEVNKLLLVQKPLKFDGTNVLDAYGNVMTISGGTNTFAISMGGITNAISNSDCATIANRLATVAWFVTVGFGAGVGTGAGAGQVSGGGNLFKQGKTINQSNLAAGCSEANTIIAASFR